MTEVLIGLFLWKEPNGLTEKIYMIKYWKNI